MKHGILGLPLASLTAAWLAIAPASCGGKVVIDESSAASSGTGAGGSTECLPSPPSCGGDLSCDCLLNATCGTACGGTPEGGTDFFCAGP